VLRIAEFENPNDVLVLLEDAFQLCELAAISGHSDIPVKIEPDRNWSRARDGLQQFGKKIIRNREIIFSNVVLKNLHQEDAWVCRIRSCSPGQEFIVRQKFCGLK
jgi:hypothetical protein